MGGGFKAEGDCSDDEGDSRGFVDIVESIPVYRGFVIISPCERCTVPCASADTKDTSRIDGTGNTGFFTHISSDRSLSLLSGFPMSLWPALPTREEVPHGPTH